jgi:hypothetical protein
VANSTGAATQGAVSRVLVLSLMLALAGCSHMPRPHVSWPWHHKPTPPPQQVHEVTITAEGGSSASFPQYWKRNTLLIDLQGATGTGSIVLKPVEGTTWPVRLAFRVMPGQFGILEVHADARMLLPITTEGSKPIDLEIAPGVYSAGTPQITVMWEPAAVPAP